MKIKVSTIHTLKQANQSILFAGKQPIIVREDTFSNFAGNIFFNDLLHQIEQHYNTFTQKATNDTNVLDVVGDAYISLDEQLKQSIDTSNVGKR